MDMGLCVKYGLGCQRMITNHERSWLSMNGKIIFFKKMPSTGCEPSNFWLSGGHSSSYAAQWKTIISKLYIYPLDTWIVTTNHVMPWTDKTSQLCHVFQDGVICFVTMATTVIKWSFLVCPHPVHYCLCIWIWQCGSSILFKRYKRSSSLKMLMERW